MLLVHGRHGNEDVPWIFARNIPDNWLIVSPRAIEFEPETDQHETGYSWIEMPPVGWPEIGDFDGAVQAMSDFAVALPDVYDADPERIIALGFSQGAATLLATAVQHPDLLQGIAALVGFVPDLDDETIQRKPLQNLSVFMAAGERDERIPVEIATQSRDTVQAAGANLEWDMYSTGHKMNGKGMRDLEAWLENKISQFEDDGVE